MPRIHERGQITLPKVMRDELGLRAGDDVTISMQEDAIVIRKSASVLDFRLPPAGRPSTKAERSVRADAAAAKAANRRV